MPRITRKQQKVFAANATNNGVFGSLQANDPVHSQDPDVIQGRTAYVNGWNDATYSAEKLPPLEEFQALQYLFSRQLAYLMQEGVAEWDTNTTYYKGALVKAIQSDGSFILYASLVDNNQGNLVTDTTKWVITNTSTNFHQGIPNWRADVIYSTGDWVKAYNSSTGWTIYESRTNSNLNNDVEDTDYWSIKPFTSEFPLLMHTWSDHLISDTSWLRADTFSWQDGTVYTNAYEHLVDDIDGVSASTETIGEYTITYYQAADGHKIVLPNQETMVSNIYSDTGVAWYYILDTTNQRFKLPRTKWGFTGLRDAVGKYVPESLPSHQHTRGTMNITGKVGYVTGENLQSGAFYKVTNGRSGTYDTYWDNRGNVLFDASRNWTGSTSDPDNETYQENAPVQQNATQMYLYFYVGNFTQTATEQTAGVTTETLNGKADTDAGNFSSTGKAYLAGIGMPSDVYEDMSTTTYTAPANGWVFFEAASGANNGYVNIVINDGTPSQREIQHRNNIGTQVTALYMPVRKGESVTCGRQSNGTIDANRFYYAEGEV